MNVTLFDPHYLKHEMLNHLLQALHITEIYSLMPVTDNIKRLLEYSIVPITVKRYSSEDLDAVKRRAVYAFVRNISQPIIVHGEWVGDCHVEDKYKESNSEKFNENLTLDDPNILILIQNTSNSNEESSIKIFSYIFNILKKYSTIDYRKRICIKRLSQYLTLDDNVLSFRYVSRETPVKVLSSYYHIEDPNQLVEKFLTNEGIKERLIEIEQEKRSVYMIDSMSDNGWGQNTEMDYIRNNGGDWIDD